MDAHTPLYACVEDGTLSAQPGTALASHPIDERDEGWCILEIERGVPPRVGGIVHAHGMMRSDSRDGYFFHSFLLQERGKGTRPLRVLDEE